MPVMPVIDPARIHKEDVELLKAAKNYLKTYEKPGQVYICYAIGEAAGFNKYELLHHIVEIDSDEARQVARVCLMIQHALYEDWNGRKAPSDEYLLKYAGGDALDGMSQYSEFSRNEMIGHRIEWLDYMIAACKVYHGLR